MGRGVGVPQSNWWGSAAQILKSVSIYSRLQKHEIKYKFKLLAMLEVGSSVIREFKKTTTAKGTGTSLRLFLTFALRILSAYNLWRHLARAHARA